ncbi:MAG: hypothetical protein R3324_02885 [Halobacteriales archaeon]|nr:hypothetical protein [Halobacteriales archaeon]
MRGPGIIGTIRLAATLVLAVPAALFGLDQVVAGRPVMGAGFLLFAILLVVMERRLFNPFDPGDVAETAAERVGDRLTEDE